MTMNNMTINNEESPKKSNYEKYAPMYKKSANEYYHKNKDLILEKRRIKYQEKKALEQKVPKQKIENYYQEIYKIKKMKERANQILKDTGIDVSKILDKYNIFLKT